MGNCKIIYRGMHENTGPELRTVPFPTNSQYKKLIQVFLVFLLLQNKHLRILYLKTETAQFSP